MDFQNSLSTTLLRMNGLPRDESGRVISIFLSEEGGKIGGGKDFESIFKDRRGFVSRDVHDDEGNMHYSAYYDSSELFANVEGALMLEWAAQFSANDARFRLARFLQSESIQKHFDLVILDSPPRDTTGGINGLCACTDVLIPSRSDDLSWNGALRFLIAASRHLDLLCRNARLLGFVGTMTPSRVRLPEIPEGLKRPLKSLVKAELRPMEGGPPKPLLAYWPSGSSFDYLGTLATRNSIAEDAGDDITYISTSGEREMIREIGDEVWKKLYSE